MGIEEAMVAIFGTGLVFGIPLSLIWTHHRRKMLELQLRLKQENEGNVRGAVDALREEVRQLRDTTLQYDLSFDNALQRLEARVGHIERRTNMNETGQPTETQIVR
jgi:hypothetical protein